MDDGELALGGDAKLPAKRFSDRICALFRSRARTSRRGCVFIACAKAWLSSGPQPSTAVVAIAAKNARMAWAVLAKGESFKPFEAENEPASY